MVSPLHIKEKTVKIVELWHISFLITSSKQRNVPRGKKIRHDTGLSGNRPKASLGEELLWMGHLEQDDHGLQLLVYKVYIYEGSSRGDVT